MKASKFLAVLAACTMAAVACDKDDDSTTTSKSLDGTLDIDDLPTYVSPGMKFDIDASAISIPEDEEIDTLRLMYIYKNSLVGSDTLYTPYYTLEIPEELGELTFTVTVKTTGYYSKTQSLTTTIIDETSLSYIKPKNRKATTDPRDGSKLYYVQNGNLYWMASNLTFGGMPYMKADAALPILGGFYNWEQAQSACPAGWSLPTLEQWDSLGDKSGDLMADAYFNNEKMWEFWPAVEITNNTGISAIPVGYVNQRDTTFGFSGMNDYAVYWASDNSKPACRYIYVEDAKVKTFTDVDPNFFYANVRCVKKKED